MADKNLTEAEKKFLAFDWSSSSEWQTYFSNLYPTPDASKLPKFKRTWFRRNVDSTLAEDSTVGDPVSPKKETTSSQQSSTPKMPHTKFFERYQNKTRLPLLKELVLRFELVLLIGFVMSVFVVITSKFKAPGTENLVKNCVNVSRSFFIIFLFVRVLRERGLPKMKMEYFNSLSNDQYVQSLMYSISFISVPPKALYYAPQLVTSLLCLSSLYKEHPSLFPRLLQIQKVKEIMTKVDQNGYFLCKLRAHLEVAILPYLVLLGFTGRGGIMPLFLYVSFLKFKINSKDVYMMNTLKGVHLKILNGLSNPKVPAVVKNMYQRAVKSLELYFTGRRR
ncbi:conserved hypothetical protein [Theileria orientalis strain Shintoku]|uniref:Transmembrane protein n=1 Tax=Theileria orientalis strain Shintoku TaxID=869250 RepID=J4D7X4_THEOR|nr:conserved hypothetical protein [Theileria orientalis strain Shintoku]BAM40430.1 conserved hypothetical protein [Theileria orientalis strain Shintoku]|eukprot:XP_009690731.1 conserved hypothetical protein [Theileria orientalis strain Shintoku]